MGNIDDNLNANRISENIGVSSEQASLARERPEKAENVSKNGLTIYDGAKLTQRGQKWRGWRKTTHWRR